MGNAPLLIYDITTSCGCSLDLVLVLFRCAGAEDRAGRTAVDRNFIRQKFDKKPMAQYETGYQA